MGLYKVEIDSKSLRNTSLIEELYLLGKEASSIGLVLLIFASLSCCLLIFASLSHCTERDGLSHRVGWWGWAGRFHVCRAGLL